jgi:hypothetical protein
VGRTLTGGSGAVASITVGTSSCSLKRFGRAYPC